MLAAKNLAKLLLPPCFFAIGNDISPLLYQIAAPGNGLIGRIQKPLSFFAERLGHRTLLCHAGGSAIGLSATDAHGSRCR
jgi:hypothetical protein